MVWAPTLVLVLAALATTGRAATWYVVSSASGTMNGTSTLPFSTIAAAIAAANNSDSIVVSGSFSESVDLAGKSLSITCTTATKAVFLGGFVTAKPISNSSVSRVRFQADTPTVKPIAVNTTSISGLQFSECEFAWDSALSTKSTTSAAGWIYASILGSGLVFDKCLFTTDDNRVLGGHTLTIQSPDPLNPTGAGQVLFTESRVAGADLTTTDDLASSNAIRISHSPVYISNSITQTGGLFVLHTALARISGCTFSGMGVILDSCSNVAIVNNEFSDIGRWTYGSQEALKAPVAITIKASSSPYETHNVNITDNKFSNLLYTSTKGYAGVCFDEYVKGDATSATLSGVYITKNDFSGVSSANLAVSSPYSSVKLYARYNFWSDSTGPTESTCNPSGTGAGVSGSSTVDYWSFCTTAVCSASVSGQNACSSSSSLRKGVVAVIVVLCAAGLAAFAGVAYLVARALGITMPAREKEQSGFAVKVIGDPRAELEEAERLEAERLAALAAASSDVDKERMERERQEQEELALRERQLEDLHVQEVEKQRVQAAQDALERERLERERLEKERLEQENAQRERERLALLEKERVEKERLDKEERDRLERERLEQERLEKERLEKERLEKERLEKERLEQERLEKERLEKERLEKERIEQERLEKERLEKERREAEELLANARSETSSSETSESSHEIVAEEPEEPEFVVQATGKEEESIEPEPMELRPRDPSREEEEEQVIVVQPTVVEPPPAPLSVSESSELCAMSSEGSEYAMLSDSE